ncbi:MAG: helix-turn-helix transcriptional regulator [Prevotella sp.]|nr:helix-turn-helix transcriptional regulator [Prevotella sp.]
MVDGTTDIYQLNSIEAYNQLYGLETFHPLVGVVDLTKSTRSINHITLNYGLYAIYLKHGVNCTLRYGRETYDYQAGTIVSFSPGQLVTIESDKDIVRPAVSGLVFHPDILYGTPIADKMRQYTFFNYDEKESLHLSEREQSIICELLDSISLEIEHPVDKHSQTLIADRIGLILDYCMRFYDRQFITRHKANSTLLENFLEQLDDYFVQGMAARDGLPQVSYFADKACLSTSYFGDLIKKETGINAKRYIQNKVIDVSKRILLEGDNSINEVAYRLGFQYPQHFTRVFKMNTGMTPGQFVKDSRNYMM